MRNMLPPRLFVGAIVLMLVAHLLVPVRALLAFPWSMTGLLPMLAGLYLNIAADRQFKEAQTTVKPFEESTRLMTDGVFAFSRNPMYLGMALALIGLALLLGSLTPWFIALLFVVVVDRRFIVMEEKMLAASFGDQFEGYRQSVRRWI